MGENNDQTCFVETNQKHARLTTKVFRKIEDIPPGDWNTVYPDVLEGYPFFKTLDESNLEQFRSYYILIYEGEIPIGAAPCFLMDYSWDTTIQGPLKIVSSAIKKLFPKIFSLRALMCGSPAGPGNIGIGGEPERVVQAIYRCMEKIAENEKVAILVFKDFSRAYTQAFSWLEQEGFCRFESMPNTKKTIHFKSFDEYLMTLSYKTRYDLKRKFKKGDGRVNIQLEVVEDLGGSLDEAYELYLQTIEKHPQIGFEIMPKEFFVKISQNMPDQVKHFLWRIEGKLVAYAFCLVSKDYLLDAYLGLDYSVAYQYHIYFVKFRDIMNWCIQNGIKTYEMGCTNYDPKKRLNFQFIPLDIYVKFRNRHINPHLKKICGFLKPEYFDPVLREMKMNAK